MLSRFRGQLSAADIRRPDGRCDPGRSEVRFQHDPL